MDFRAIVENNGYKEEDLDDANKEYYRGFEQAIEKLDIVIDNIIEDEDEEDTIKEKLLNEIRREFAEEIKEYMECCKCGLLVSLLDNQEDDGEKAE